MKITIKIESDCLTNEISKIIETKDSEPDISNEYEIVEIIEDCLLGLGYRMEGKLKIVAE